MDTNNFALDLKLIRERARAAAKGGAEIHRPELCRLLNEALATELVCTMRYKQSAYKCKGVLGQIVADEFFEHAREEMAHADKIAERIDQLGGEPDFAPDVLLERSHTEYKVPNSIDALLRENLTAELIAIDTYSELIRHIGDKDPTTRRMLEDILANEEEHASELSEMLERDHKQD